MDPSIDPFQPLLRLLDRYRQDVHALRPPATEEMIRGVENTLGITLPLDLPDFLARWNGANLFRGALKIRSLAELAPVDQAHPKIVVFADGPRADERWAFVQAPTGEHILGTWDGNELKASFYRFQRWLSAILTLVDTHVKSDSEQLDTMLLCDPKNSLLLLHKAERIIASGDPDLALPLLRQASAEDPDLLPTWQRLGDVLVATDPSEARFAYIRALRAMRLPLPYPGFPSANPDLLLSLRSLFPPGDAAWERELIDFLDERITDILNEQEADFAEAVGMSLAKILLGRGERSEARQVLTSLLDRSRAFTFSALFPRIRVQVARLETDLGHHDEAEERLRPLHDHQSLSIRIGARLALARIILIRQEPWGEDVLQEILWMLSEARGEGRHAIDLTSTYLLLAERHLLANRQDQADSALRQAENAITRHGVNTLRTLLLLLQGDLRRLQDQPSLAERLYREAEALATEQGDTELRLRLGVRAGQIAMQRGDHEHAARAFSNAAEGFQKLNLPIREAWSLYRLGLLGNAQALKRARQIFEEADLAVGVTAVDSARRTTIDLDWHLRRASDYARQRSEAQRARPPRTRADADRPERRLGGHELAVAASEINIVGRLGGAIQEISRGLEGASCLPGDPRLASYTAAVHLLAHHRSYEASKSLLEQIQSRFISGPPGRALMAAITRSPNFALVDGLLEILGRGEDPVAMARCAEVLGWRREPLATEHLRELVRDGRPRHLRRAGITALGRIGCAEAIEDIVPALDDPEMGEIAAIALLLLGDRRGVSYHSQILLRAEKRGGSPGEIVGRYGDPSYLLLLLATAEREDDASLGAMQGLGYLGDPRSIPRLIELLGRREPRTVEVAAGALEILTGHNEKLEEPQVRARWARYWEQNESRFTPGMRYRFGRPLDPGLLIEKLGDDDLATRSTAYDELVITTGMRLPFDAEGAWRVQVHHREEWSRWWHDAHSSFPSGRWTFHGRVTG